MKSSLKKSHIVYQSSCITDAVDNSHSNLNVNVIENNKTKINDSNKPWEAYYLTSDEFFDICRVAFDDTYGSNHRWHPEDLYVNVSSVVEVVSNTLNNMVKLKSSRPLSGIKNS